MTQVPVAWFVVTVTDVRKRLLRYYEIAPASALHVDLPPGSCIPEFHHVATDSKASPLLVVEAGLERDLNGISGDHALGHALEVVSTGSIEANRDTHDQTGGTWRRFHAFSVRLAVLVGSLCLAFLALGWSMGTLHGRDARATFHQPAILLL